MKKEDLISLGISDEQAAEVMEISKKEIESGYVLKSRFNEVSEELKQSRKEVSSRDKQLEELKKADPESLKEQIKKLQEENKANTEAYKTELNKMKIDNAVEIALINSKAKNMKAVKALLNLENAELDDAGGIKGLNKQLEELVKNESYLFNSDNKTDKSGFKGVKAAESRSTAPTADVTKMSYEELCEYMKSNPDVQV